MGSLKHTIIGVARVGFEIRPRLVKLRLRLSVSFAICAQATRSNREALDLSAR